MRSLAGAVVIVIICFVAVAAVKWRDEGRDVGADLCRNEEL